MVYNMGYGEACRGDVALLKQGNPANLAGRGDVALLKQGNPVTLAGRGVEFKETIRTCLIQTGAKLSLSLILALDHNPNAGKGAKGSSRGVNELPKFTKGRLAWKLGWGLWAGG